MGAVGNLMTRLSEDISRYNTPLGPECDIQGPICDKLIEAMGRSCLAAFLAL
jgi:hypothetical protein